MLFPLKSNQLVPLPGYELALLASRLNTRPLVTKLGGSANTFLSEKPLGATNGLIDETVAPLLLVIVKLLLLLWQ